MKGSLILLWCLAVASGFVLKVDEDDNQWKAWKDFHGKTYASESEETTRKAIWRDNHMVREEPNGEKKNEICHVIILEMIEYYLQ